jgi:hypothetical protein
LTRARTCFSKSSSKKASVTGGAVVVTALVRLVGGGRLAALVSVGEVPSSRLTGGVSVTLGRLGLLVFSVTVVEVPGVVPVSGS